jgi:hypothetical protein
VLDLERAVLSRATRVRDPKGRCIARDEPASSHGGSPLAAIEVTLLAELVGTDRGALGARCGTVANRGVESYRLCAIGTSAVRRSRAR